MCPARVSRHTDWNSQSEAATRVVERIEAEGGEAIALQLDVGNTDSFSHFRAELEQVMKSRWEDGGWMAL